MQASVVVAHRPGPWDPVAEAYKLSCPTASGLSQDQQLNLDAVYPLHCQEILIQWTTRDAPVGEFK